MKDGESLERKGLLRHDEDGVRYVFSATTSPTVARRTALQQYVQTFFSGSLHRLVTALVQDDSWTDDELRQIRGEIDRVRKERNK